MRDGEARGLIEPGLAGGAALGLLAVALEKVTALGIALYLPRHLGLEDYGRYALLMSYLGLFQGLADASLESVLVTRLARAEAPAALAGRGAVVRLAVSVAGALTALLTLAIATGDAALVRAGAIAAAAFAAGAANPYRLLLRARLALGRYLGLVAGQAALGVMLLALVVREGGGLGAVFAALAAAALGGLVLGAALVRGGVEVALDGALGRALLRDAWPLAGTTAALAGAQQVLQIVLFRAHGAVAVGFLGGAQRLIDAIALVPQALMVSLLPSLSRAAAAPGAASARAGDAARLLAVLIVPAVAGLLLWPEPVLARAFGTSFVAAAPTLRWLAPLALVGATGMVTTNLLLALGLQRVLLRVAVAAALLMLIAGIWVVPAAGAQGAAAVLLVTWIGGQLALLALPLTRAYVAPVLAAAMRPLAVGALAAGVARWVDASWMSAAAFVVVYAALLVPTRAVTAADLARWRGN
jgi:O-antigen/teichoic acid export membrane protein